MNSKKESKAQVLTEAVISKDSRLENGVTLVPQHIGSGFIKGFVISADLRLVVREYELKEEWILDRGIGKQESKLIMIAFHNIYLSNDDIKSQLSNQSISRRPLPSVQVATTGFNIEHLPANKKISSIVITISTTYLKELLKPKIGNTLLQMIASGDQPFLFEEIISPQINGVGAEIVTAKPIKELQDFYYKIKAEELIYLLFVELLKREDTTIQALNRTDVDNVYRVKDKLLLNIETPPVFSDLVKLSGMSESKLKRLFKQIFGSSIYSYYQSFRMKEAAYLIRQEKLSVSQVGYRLGFSNLGHFTKLFEAHIGVKPKKYATGK